MPLADENAPPGFVWAACPRCGSRESTVVIRGKDYLHGLPGEYNACACDACNLWFLNPRPSPDRAADLYPTDYASQSDTAETDPPLDPGLVRYVHRQYGYAGAPVDNRLALDRRWDAFGLDWWRRWTTGVRLVPHYVPSGRVLEIGCSSGYRLALLRTLGWSDLRGIEFVPAAAERARARGLDVDCGPVEDWIERYPTEHFDVVIASMVLEHLVNPFEIVRRVARALRPGGQFLFSTVVRDSLDAQIFGQYWAGFDFPRHLIYFDKRDMLGMVRDFANVETFHHSSPVDFLRPAEWRRAEGHAIDRVIARVARSRVRHRLGDLLAWARLTCRVSVRCTKPR